MHILVKRFEVVSASACDHLLIGDGFIRAASLGFPAPLLDLGRIITGAEWRGYADGGGDLFI
jgi:hypothetical protein